MKFNVSRCIQLFESLLPLFQFFEAKSMLAGFESDLLFLQPRLINTMRNLILPFFLQRSAWHSDFRHILTMTILNDQINNRASSNRASIKRMKKKMISTFFFMDHDFPLHSLSFCPFFFDTSLILVKSLFNCIFNNFVIQRNNENIWQHRLFVM